jgi:hypothetical protein
LEQLSVTLQAIERYDAKIAAVAKTLPDYRLFSSLPGAGQTFIEWAGATIPRSFWAAAYYHRQIDKGCSHRMAVRALAFKWIRILYRC